MKYFCCLFLFTLLVPATCSRFSEMNGQTAFNKDTIFLAAHEIIDETAYCGLVTLDLQGLPQIRTMNPFPVKEDFIVWFATSRTSRKVKEIRNNPGVCVYFADHSVAKGYVNLKGKASVIDDKELLLKMKRDYWDGIAGWQDRFVLIKIIPVSIEVINYKHGLHNDPETLQAPFLPLQ